MRTYFYCKVSSFFGDNIVCIEHTKRHWNTSTSISQLVAVQGLPDIRGMVSVKLQTINILASTIGEVSAYERKDKRLNSIQSLKTRKDISNVN